MKKQTYFWERRFSDKENGKRWWRLECWTDSKKFTLCLDNRVNDINHCTSWKKIITKSVDKIINWLTIDWKKITLFEIFNYRSCQKYYYSSYVFFDIHYWKKEDISFDYMIFSLEGLFGWLWQSVFWWELDNPFNPKKINIQINNMKEVILWEFDGLNVKWICSHRWKYKSKDIITNKNPIRLPKSMFLEQDSFIKIKAKKWQIWIEKVEYILLNFKRIFSLIFKKSVKYTNIELYSWKKKINFLSTYWIYEKENNDTKNEHCLFLKDELDFKTLVRKRFLEKNKFNTIYNLYFSTIWNRGLVLENKFLNFIQAIDWMYFISSIKKVKEEDKVIKECKKFIENIEDKKIRARLQCRDFSLTHKLKLVFNHIWFLDFIKNLDYIIKDKDWKEITFFWEILSYIRNIFSHWWNRKELNIETKDMMNFVAILQTILELFILRERIDDDDEIYKKIKKIKIFDLKLAIVD